MWFLSMSSCKSYFCTTLSTLGKVWRIFLPLTGSHLCSCLTVHHCGFPITRLHMRKPSWCAGPSRLACCLRTRHALPSLCFTLAFLPIISLKTHAAALSSLCWTLSCTLARLGRHCGLTQALDLIDRVKVPVFLLIIHMCPDASGLTSISLIFWICKIETIIVPVWQYYF